MRQHRWQSCDAFMASYLAKNHISQNVDLDKAAEWTAFGIFWTNGQICSATSRLIVQILQICWCSPYRQKV
ncbi:hypothetical protein FRX31_024979 [Thalictrum thalictroides]|uniref:Aldehyde dehydrogenase domain-containing protein n=1 Tax=Thalictrum thalictroides TaxID=46969 RepID=A0A7J6VMR1_THATH|nr:hypothetical protein FRX31_024979 [Thalictrum thalictroides]